jgi:hypothetical protein
MNHIKNILDNLGYKNDGQKIIRGNVVNEKLINKEVAITDVGSKIKLFKDETTSSVIRSSVNAEKMPIAFLGTKEERLKIQLEIATTGKPLVIYDEVKDGEGKKLSIAPSAVYGLPTGFDTDVLTAINYILYQEAKRTGECPKNIRIQLSEMPKIMKLQKAGYLYNRIKESVKRISETNMYHENFVKVKNGKTGILQSYEESSLKMFHYTGMYKESTSAKDGKEVFFKLYIDLEIPDWTRNNINNGYTTEYDPEVYFSLRNDRSKRLYRILEFIRYEKVIFIPFEKIVKNLHLINLPNKDKNRGIKRAFEPLLKNKYIEAFEIQDFRIMVRFREVKSRRNLKFNAVDSNPSITEQEEAFVDLIIEELGDEGSRQWFRNVVLKVPQETIHKCLSLTKETAQISGIRKSKGAVFTDHLKRECELLRIVL